MQGIGVSFLGREDLLENPVFLPGESQRQMSLMGYNPWGLKELDTTEQLFSLIHFLQI